MVGIFCKETMDKKLPPNETAHDTLVGVVSIKLKEQTDFNVLGAKLAGYDANKYEAVALRVYIENKPVVTVYARPLGAPGLQVEKFKTEMSLDDLFFNLRQLNFTVTTGEYEIDDMEVIG